MPDFALESDHDGLVCGVDEAGRGPLAGPLVVAAAILDPARLPVALRDGLDDSKALAAARREALFAALQDSPAARLSIVVVDVAEIERLNILGATLAGMARAVAGLGAPPPTLALVDGNRPPTLAPEPPCAVRCVVRGDAKSLTIAAASIAAKVTRDRLMVALDARYPGYGWARNMGYGTAEHRAALLTQGVTPEHRRGYAPVRAALAARETDAAPLQSPTSGM
ncbi:ribonuclease HII [Roseospira marina]|uniref:Ribonuclease HII n=1 Tax=Roseospira marina TaxID=140057 RepID=A0A5M6IAG7_9PROT|nr:ribonuclease HII [Roseospira marina]KAA5604658.1 ribonuclease HII [Roseospira marina]MBB4315103.1 ribonuclease HII [Roseospira marina]MBB5088127.1 ribonuclease HII [Roseospira marina]